MASSSSSSTVDRGMAQLFASIRKETGINVSAPSSERPFVAPEFQLVAVARNVDVTNETDFRGYSARVFFYSDKIGRCLVRVRIGTRLPAGPLYPLSGILPNGRAMMIYNGIDVVGFREATGKADDNSLHMSTVLRLKFASVRHAHLFIRQIKGFVGNHDSMPENDCPHSLTRQQLAHRRLIDVENSSEDEELDFYLRENWLELERVNPPVQLRSIERYPNWEGIEWYKERLNEFLQDDLQFCSQHGGKTQDQHDNETSIQVYSSINDGNILAAIDTYQNSGLAANRCFFMFENPFNVPHLLRSGNKGISPLCVHIKKPKMSLLEGGFDNLESQRTYAVLETQLNSVLDSSEGQVRALNEDVAPFWSFILGEKKDLNGSRMRTLAPCCLYLPSASSELIEQDKICLFRTQALIYNAVSWEASDVVIALTEKPSEQICQPFRPIFQRNDGENNYVERWARMIPIKMIDNALFKATDSPAVHWVLLLVPRRRKTPRMAAEFHRDAQ